MGCGSRAGEWHCSGLPILSNQKYFTTFPGVILLWVLTALWDWGLLVSRPKEPVSNKHWGSGSKAMHSAVRAALQRCSHLRQFRQWSPRGEWAGNHTELKESPRACGRDGGCILVLCSAVGLVWVTYCCLQQASQAVWSPGIHTRNGWEEMQMEEKAKRKGISSGGAAVGGYSATVKQKPFSQPQW